MTALVFLLVATACTPSARVVDASSGAPLLAEFPNAYEPPEVSPEPMAQPENRGFGQGLGDGGKCPSSWSCQAAGSPKVGVDNDIAKHGKQALRVTFSNPDGQYRATSERIPVRNGREVEAEVPMRSSIRGKGAESVILTFYDSDGNEVASERQRSPKHGANTWYTVSAAHNVPGKADTMTVTVTAAGYDRDVWFDRVRSSDVPRVEVWGGTRMSSDKDGRTLTLQLRTPSEDGVYIGKIEGFGDWFHVAGPRRMVTSDGHALSYEMDNGPEYVDDKHALRVPKGQTGTIEINGDALQPEDGSAYPKLVLGDPVNDERYHVWVALEEVSDTEELRSVVRFVYADELSTTVRDLSDHLEQRRRPDGGWDVAHEKWPGDEQPDPMAIARAVQGYVFLSERADNPAESDKVAHDRERAIGGLDWLVENQHDHGGFGLPWKFGSSTGHLGGWEHYPGQDERAHPPNHPYAISTAIAGEALLDGYRAFSDERYLKAAEKAADYLLKSKNGFQYVDADQTRGSIPYCTLEPVMPADDPRAQQHDVVDPLKNTAIEVFNIDGASLSFLTSLYEHNEDDELLKYGDALARNLTVRMHDSGEMPYAWYHEDYYSGGYPRIVYNGLREWGQLRGDKGEKWIDASIRGYSWLANEAYGALLPTEEGYSTAHGLGLSGDSGDYINRLLDDVRDDGSYSGGSNTRKETTNFAVLAELLKAMEE